MNRKILITASILGLLSIVLGAFGAHGLKQVVSTESVATFETGVKYQMYHALLLLFVGMTTTLSIQKKRSIFILVLLGIIFFSGSIYGLSTNELTSFDFKSIALITPIGGTLLIIGWGLMLLDFIKNKDE